MLQLTGIMANLQESQTIRDLDLEVKMHRIFDPWSEAHRQQYQNMGVLPYDPETYPEQRIDIHTVPPRIDSTRIPVPVFIWAMRRKLLGTFQDKEKGRKFFESFWTSCASSDEKAPLALVVAEDYLRQGKSVAVVTDHADNLTDIARATASLNIALAEKFGSEHMSNFGILVNKNVTREKHQNRSVVRKIGDIASVHMVLPNTQSAEKYRKIASRNGDEITEDDVRKISQKVTGGSAKSIFRRIKDGHDGKAHGIVEGIVPTGQGTIKLRNKHGAVQAHTIPPVTETAAGLLCRFDAVIAVSLIADEFKISPLIALKDYTTKQKDPFNNLLVTEDIMDILATQTTEIAGVPVSYQRQTPANLGRIAIS